MNFMTLPSLKRSSFKTIFFTFFTNQVIKLWSDLSAIYSGRRAGVRRHRPTLQEIANSDSGFSRRRRQVPRNGISSRLSRKDTPAGFPTSSRPTLPSNLFSAESHFRSRSTDSETMEAAAAFGNDTPLLKSPVPQNPMDFEYFEKLVKSEDEARHQVKFSGTVSLLWF